MNQANTIICPLCNDPVDKLLYRYHIDNEKLVLVEIRKNNPTWTEGDGACSRCVDYYHTEVLLKQRMLPEIGPHFPIRSADDFIILPTGLRLDADQRFTGAGITICFIDSGFYLHPDLITHNHRVKKILDVTMPEREIEYFMQPRNESWHGTMTSVVCAGDGYLGNGLYKGIAKNSDLVLLKVQEDGGGITNANIVKALRWVVDNHLEYGIRIVNMSLGGEEVISYKNSEIDLLAEQLVELGIVVVAAVGNDENGSIKPPANSPNVISVGGFDDGNNLGITEMSLYHSSYGSTIDELMKPELIAHAIWIAAPILPGTKEHKEATALYELIGYDDCSLIIEIANRIRHTNLDDTIVDSVDPAFIRQAIRDRIQHCKFISPHYMHVDGTSFASPIVCSMIAQLLEVNPDLDPGTIREILFSTARRLEGWPAERQGFGLVNARRALLKILKRENIMTPTVSPNINVKDSIIEFYLHNECATQISLAGTFNHWAQDVLLMEPGKNGIWKIQIPIPPAGKHYYKFFVDDKTWTEDVNNPFREPDGFSGFNSVLIIEN